MTQRVRCPGGRPSAKTVKSRKNTLLFPAISLSNKQTRFFFVVLLLFNYHYVDCVEYQCTLRLWYFENPNDNRATDGCGAINRLYPQVLGF